ncbi:MAG: penicillin-binding protein 2 [Desulfobacterales bacterium]|uniref:Penicillin-binding protein 2 n=1 Tax=Candidatus Desulfatibia vada TaxID=2841696 RepID=A0A8J6NSQ0_9BACT|nr:penicillin-binding protein 2 [Candidatus Desulfatibia vada]
MTKYLNVADTDWYRQRLIRVTYCVAAAFCLLFVRLLHLQVIQGEELRRLSENNSVRLERTDPSRGLIFDRDGKTLVDNRPSFDLSIILKDARPVADTIEKLARVINVPASELMLKINRSKGVAAYKPILLKQDFGRDALAAVEVRKFDLAGVVVGVRPLRHSLNKQSAAHLIGYLSEINAGELKSGKYPGTKSGDFIGKFGVEKAFESFLRGKRGGRQVEVNATGQVVDILKTVDAQPGHNIYLTIDQMLQKRTEALLKGLAGAAVAMDPATGHILAMASSPSFDQNDFVSGMSHAKWSTLISNPFRPMENKAIQAEYPPASAYKIVTAMAGLEEGVIDETTSFHCPGYYKYGDRVFRCWEKKGHGNVNVVQALIVSCDVFFYQVGQKLGADRLAWYAKASGLGSTTGINLDQEAEGLIPTTAWKKERTGRAWQGGETLSVAIGQGYDLVTPIQMLVLTSAVANGGTIYKPLILKMINTAEGKIVVQAQSQVKGKLPAGSQTLELIKKGLWGVVNDSRGTAKAVRIKGIDVSGKTGTVQVVGRKDDEEASETEKPDHLKAHAWFVAYAPSVDPQIAVAVIVEHGESGSKAAAPIAREMIRTYLKKTGPGKQLKAEGSTLEAVKVVNDG